jgi:2-iminobutanoate/2-iminopropanoate deaminase
MARQAVTSDRIAPPVGPFSQAVRAGEFLYLSGQVAQDRATGTLIAGDIAAHTDHILHNLARVLEAAGKTMDDVIRVGVFLTDMADFPAMNAAYAKHFAPPYPARTTIAVAALPLGARIEIELVAK